jgi:hypothetical protein
MNEYTNSCRNLQWKSHSEIKRKKVMIQQLNDFQCVMLRGKSHTQKSTWVITHTHTQHTYTHMHTHSRGQCKMKIKTFNSHNRILNQPWSLCKHKALFDCIGQIWWTCTDCTILSLWHSQKVNQQRKKMYPLLSWEGVKRNSQIWA